MLIIKTTEYFTDLKLLDNIIYINIYIMECKLALKIAIYIYQTELHRKQQ